MKKKEGSNMVIVDILIFIFIFLGFVVGFKRGFSKEVVSFLGFLLVFILAYYLKNPVSNFLFKVMPFFSFDGIFKGITSLNILVYEVIAFFLVLSLLMLVFKLLIFATGIFEKFLDFTIILGLPSKILGGILGLVQGFIGVYIVLFFLMLPVFHIKAVQDSTVASAIIEKTPVMSNVMGNVLHVITDMDQLKEEYQKTEDPNKFNLEALDLMLKYHIIDIDNVKILEKMGKLKMDGINRVIHKYERMEGK